MKTALSEALTLADERFSRQSVTAIIADAARKFTVTPADILSLRQDAEVVAARRFAMWSARQRTSLSISELALMFRRDRATVLYQIRRQKELNATAHAALVDANQIELQFGGDQP